ncbi:MAG: hypothetical protein LBU91_03935 [Bacteroidales bacterium]|jgi:hypothetical protein|nr:hypothetical protein [Bacteroidales bacterium]
MKKISLLFALSAIALLGSCGQNAPATGQGEIKSQVICMEGTRWDWNTEGWIAANFSFSDSGAGDDVSFYFFDEVTVIDEELKYTFRNPNLVVTYPDGTPFAKGHVEYDILYITESTQSDIAVGTYRNRASDDTAEE